MTGPSCRPAAAASHSYLLGRKLDAELGDDGSVWWVGIAACVGCNGLIGCNLGAWLWIGIWVFEAGKVLCVEC